MDKYKKIFIQNKANEIINNNTKEYVEKMLPFYVNVLDDDLAFIFAYFHHELNQLFHFMNHKININRHYNADESRELISLISNIEHINKELQDTRFDFTMEEEYFKNIEVCKTFLDGSGGSAIPDEVEKIDIIESKPIFKLLFQDSPMEKNIKFDDEQIHSQWQKALERKSSDPEGAITLSRSLIESILKYILDEKQIKYNDNSDLSELYKETAKSLNLAPEQHQEKIFKQILGGANGIISGLGSLRNKLGDSHGKGKNNIKPKERHSELAVNLAGTMALFLYKTFKEQKNG